MVGVLASCTETKVDMVPVMVADKENQRNTNHIKKERKRKEGNERKTWVGGQTHFVALYDSTYLIENIFLDDAQITCQMVVVGIANKA